jgi:hypothetical protein
MRPLRRVVALVLAATAALGSPVAGAVAPTVLAHRAALPSGATGIASGLLTTLACPAAGSCEAAGSYAGPYRGVFGVVLNERRGRWVAPSVLRAPANASTSSPDTAVTTLACPALGRCVAGGSYADGGGDVLAFLADQSGNAWPQAATVTLPAGALTNGQDASVRSVACAAPGQCVAVGTYLDNAPVSRSLAFVALETGGAWGAAREVPLPTPANLDPFVALAQAACAGPGRCVAVGSYVDANDVTQGLAVTFDHGSVTASVVAPPSDASSYAGTTLAEVACVAGGPCTVIGTYYNATGAVEPMVAASSSAQWPSATAIAMPAGARRNPKILLYGYQGISCAAAGWCAAGGQYLDARGHYQGFLATQANGVWRQAARMPLPAEATSGGANGGVVSVACPAVGRCLAGGAYLDGAQRYQAILLRESPTGWTGTRVRLPGSSSTVGVDGGLYALACAPGSACVGVGSYESGVSYQGFTLDA